MFKSSVFGKMLQVKFAESWEGGGSGKKTRKLLAKMQNSMLCGYLEVAKKFVFVVVKMGEQQEQECQG